MHLLRTNILVVFCVCSHVCVCVCERRYASLYFCCAVEEQDNELITLEVILYSRRWNIALRILLRISEVRFTSYG